MANIMAMEAEMEEEAAEEEELKKESDSTLEKRWQTSG
jgi:hypothetical protein